MKLLCQAGVDDDSPYVPQEWWLFLLEHDHGRSLQCLPGASKKDPPKGQMRYIWSQTQRQPALQFRGSHLVFFFFPSLSIEMTLLTQIHCDHYKHAQVELSQVPKCEIVCFFQFLSLQSQGRRGLRVKGEGTERGSLLYIPWKATPADPFVTFYSLPMPCPFPSHILYNSPSVSSLVTGSRI